MSVRSQLRVVDACQLWLPFMGSDPDAAADDETVSRLRGKWRVLKSAPPDSWHLPSEDVLPRRLRRTADELHRLLMRCAMAGVPSASIAKHIGRTKRRVDALYEELAREADGDGSSRERLLGRIWDLKEAEEEAARQRREAM